MYMFGNGRVYHCKTNSDGNQGTEKLSMLNNLSRKAIKLLGCIYWQFCGNNVPEYSDSLLEWTSP